MNRQTILAAATLAALLATSACSKSDGASSFPAVTGSTSAPPSASQHSDVTIPRQLDTTAFVSNPCSTITAEQTVQLDISREGRAANDTGCTWKFGPNLEWSLQIYFVVPAAKNGLQNLYDQKAAGWYDNGYFEPTTVEEYPAAFNSSTDFRPQGTCDLSVGVNNETMMSVTVHGQAGKENCNAAKNGAISAIRTIKAGGQ